LGSGRLDDMFGVFDVAEWLVVSVWCS